ncbi:MAG: hypothetical protein J3K34DRAFT_399882, partial [Monoraphidium minutum]
MIGRRAWRLTRVGSRAARPGTRPSRRRRRPTRRRSTSRAARGCACSRSGARARRCGRICASLSIGRPGTAGILCTRASRAPRPRGPRCRRRLRRGGTWPSGPARALGPPSSARPPTTRCALRSKVLASFAMPVVNLFVMRAIRLPCAPRLKQGKK